MERKTRNLLVALVIVIVIIIIVWLFTHGLRGSQKKEKSAMAYARFIKTNTTGPTSMLRYGMPLSYRVDPDYYDSVGMGPAAVGAMSSADRYAAISEINLQTQGINIYDAAVRLVALGLLAKLGDSEAKDMGYEWIAFLAAGASFPGETTPGALGTDNTWTYGENNVALAAGQGFWYRETGPRYKITGQPPGYCCIENTLGGASPDLKATGGACVCPPGATETGSLYWIWNEWRPVAGENAWAGLIAPLQFEYQVQGADVLSKTSAGLSLALTRVDAFAAMQFTLAINGTPQKQGIYYSPKSQFTADCATSPSNPCFAVSTENNASALAGLKMLSQFSQIPADTQAKINTLITGITSFIVNYCFRSSQTVNGVTVSPCIISGITLPYGSRAPADMATFAVDVHTWTMAVLYRELEEAHGPGTCYALWQSVKTYGGAYGNDGSFRGVGYSLNGGGGPPNVLSGEWTYGAINCCRVLLRFYSGSNPDYAKSLDADIQSMQQGVDSALKEELADSAGDYAVHYSDKRYFIPFGWWANRNLSLASTGWAMFDALEWNPFKF